MALQLLAEMQELGIQPDVLSCEAALKSGIQADVMTYEAASRACEKSQA